MNVDTQRNNRRSGYLKKQTGHARFDLFDLLSMTFIVDAAKFGIGPKVSTGIAEWVAHHALYFALISNEAYKTDEGDRPLDARCMEVFKSVFGRPRILGNRVAVIWADGSDYYCDSVDRAVDSLEDDDPRNGQPMMVVDLAEFANRITKRIGTPSIIRVG